MRQVLILRIHADCALVNTSLFWIQLGNEGEVVTLTLNHLKRLDREDMILAIGIGNHINLLQSYSIVKTLFVDDIFYFVLLTAYLTCCRQVPLAADDIDAIPAFCDIFLPEGNLLSQLEVVLGQFLESLSLFLVELGIIVIELTLHGVVRSYLCDRILDDLNPTLGDAVLVLIVIKRCYLVLDEIIDGCSIELVLMLLILIGALLSQCPSSTLAIAFEPPSVLDREVYDTVHLGLLA